MSWNVLCRSPRRKPNPRPRRTSSPKSPPKQALSLTPYPAHPAEPQSESNPLEQDTYLQQCIADLTRQLLAAPAKKGASVTPITLAGYKLLIATWEAEAFTKGNDRIASA